MPNPPERIEVALGAMGGLKPRNLRAYLRQPGPDFDPASPSDVDAMIDLLLSNDPNSPGRLRFSDLLRSWDNAKDADWIAGTARNTAERRRTIHQLLKTDAALSKRIDDLIPFFHLEEPLIIAKSHVDWYAPQPSRDYYWTAYKAYLRERRGWSGESLLALENSTRAIVECLANPAGHEAYASRGLVMGYVQSGKTANFAGVTARAADAGYRLIIILAGTWNILRNQTQRRMDKELLGKEFLANDEFYQTRPSDWDEFLEHRANPWELGQFTWQRLTRPEIDLRRLKAAIDNLEFERRNRAVPIYHPDNLYALPCKLLVIKKHSLILKGLVKDLGLLRTRLADLPALVIDDESDQAGINTRDPRKVTDAGKERTSTNQAIVDLLGLLPRGQYIGYTATPYANALVNPDDPKDLFPKDFIISLDRPIGYMGVSDFFDPLTDFMDLTPDDYTQPEIAYIRRVEAPQGQDQEDLKTALRAFVLAGAVKLYRQAADPRRYPHQQFQHHTMLIHTSSRKGEHATLADGVGDLWDQCAFNSPRGAAALADLWASDFARVSAAQGTDEIIPPSFAALVPHVSVALQRIIEDPRFIRLVNSDIDDAPDFSAGPVWKIVIGGNKLSRGYTLEGLTVSYYRRVANNADTLMQMGRWFGFRRGYRDLVRVFLGVKEGKAGSDLVALFKDVCLMEERFREEITRYVRRPDAPRITPRQIPPLIAVSGNLPPTARNKMFNAVLTSKNFGEKWSMPTLTAAEKDSITANVDCLRSLLGAATSLGRKTLGGVNSRSDSVSADSVLYQVTTQQLIAFLAAYRWLESEYTHPERPADIALQIAFLEKQEHGISDWLVVAPQRKQSNGQPLRLTGDYTLTVKERRRPGNRGFQGFGEPDHRIIAGYLASIEPDGKPRLDKPNSATQGLRDPRRGIMLLYPVRPQESDPISIGFELLFPRNDLPYDLNFSVRKKIEADIVVA